LELGEQQYHSCYVVERVERTLGFVISFWKQAHMPKKTMLQTWDNYIVKN
jgi:hypothetical protein